MPWQEHRAARKRYDESHGPEGEIQQEDRSGKTYYDGGEYDTADVDAFLDEIDGLIEENTEEFVDSFIQRGGE